VALQTVDDIFDKMTYVLANPVVAGLVRRGAEWPGPWSAPSRIGAEMHLVRRPDHYFRKDGPTPPTARLELTCPAGFDSVELLRERLSEELERREDQAARDLAAEGRPFMGARKVQAQSAFARPASAELRRGLKPRVASRDRWKRLEAIGRLKGFLAEYRQAWRAFRGGARGVLFPEGTYWMRLTCGVACSSGG